MKRLRGRILESIMGLVLKKEGFPIEGCLPKFISIQNFGVRVWRFRV